MPKELKGLPYRISFKVLQIYGKFLSALPLREIVEKSGNFLAGHVGDFVVLNIIPDFASQETQKMYGVVVSYTLRKT